MTDHTLVEIPAPAAEPAGPAAGPRDGWRRWLSTALFALVVGCFALPFASTSCTLPGGYGRGAQGTSTVYRGVDLAFDSVPAVTPGDRAARPDALPNDGQLGFQPLALLALLAAATGVALAIRLRAVTTLALAALTGTLLAAGQLVAVAAIATHVAAHPLPSGRSQTDYVGTGVGLLVAVLIIVLLLAVNGAVALWESRRTRAPG